MSQDEKPSDALAADPMTLTEAYEEQLEGKTFQEVPDCPHCGEERYFYAATASWRCNSQKCVERRHQEEQEAARSERAKEIDDLAERMGVPARYRHCKRSTWDDSISPWPARDLGAWEGRSVGDPLPSMTFVSGPTGTGKTHLATTLFRAALIEHGSGIWVASFEFLEDSRRVIDNREKPSHRMDDYLSTPVLLLDDLGWNAIRKTEFALDRVSFLVSSRYNWMRPTIITSNQTPLEMNEIDPHLASRMCSEIVIARSGPDERMAR